MWELRSRKPTQIRSNVEIVGQCIQWFHLQESLIREQFQKNVQSVSVTPKLMEVVKN